MTEKQGCAQACDTVPVNLHKQLKQHQEVLEAEGMVPELGAFVCWTDNVAKA